MIATNFKSLLSTLIFTILMSVFNLAFATVNGIKLPQTRVIFDGNMKNATASIQNRGDSVYLIKASIHSVDDTTSIDNKSPFIVTPPLFRLESKSTQAILIIRQDTQSLPNDKESIFYLSFLAIPSTTDKKSYLENSNIRMSVGVETVIKLFYRPVGLISSAKESIEKLTFVQEANKLIVSNPTPYYITLSTLSVNKNLIDLNEAGSMIAPFSRQQYSYTEKIKKISWSGINDYGGISDLYHRNIAIRGEGQ